MHSVSCEFRLPPKQLVNKGNHHEAAPKAKKHRGDTGSEACQRNDYDIVQDNVPI